MCPEVSSPRDGDAPVELSSILGDPRQRRILSILCDRSDPISDRELSSRLADRRFGKATTNGSENDAWSIWIDLQHRCLPQLEAVGWIERHPDGIVAVESLPFRNEESPLPDLRASEDSFWEAVSALLVQPRRQELISIIADEGSPLTVDELATKLGESGQAWETTEQRDDDPVLPGVLHHFDLPRLAAVGLIEYDPATKRIAGTPFLMRQRDRIYLCTRLISGIDPDRNV